MENRITRNYLASLPYGAPLVREFDLVLAANILNHMTMGDVLYEDTLSQRVAEFCAPFDHGLEQHFLGVIPVPTVEGELPYQTLKRLHGDLANKPRGHWAIYERAGRYDSWISNGINRAETISGHKFIYTRADAASLNFQSIHSAVYSWATYNHRKVIEAEIAAYSVRMSHYFPGMNFKNFKFNGAVWSNFTYVRTEAEPSVEGAAFHVIHCSRRGVKTKQFTLSDLQFLKVMSIAPVMPPHYEDPRNSERLMCLSERRIQHAQDRWNRLTDPALNELERKQVLLEFDMAEDIKFSTYASKACFRFVDDTLERQAYTADPREQPSHPTFLYKVTFAPGSAQILSSSITQQAA